MNTIQLLRRGSARSGTIQPSLVTFFAAWLLALSAVAQADPTAQADALLRKAESAFRSGQNQKALALADQAILVAPENFNAYGLRARVHSALDHHEKAIQDYDRALQGPSPVPALYHYRGVEHFMLGQVDPSVADFDRFLELVPDQDPYHWQRGISYYYAGKFEEGQKQFERHQTVNPNDVENAVWHFLCVARRSGLEKARASLIPIKGDSRVPMKEVHQLFAGKATPETVLKAAQSGKPDSERQQRQLFYAHLYLGLYYEAKQDDAKTREHIFKAAELSKDQSYMGAVARVHAAMLRAAQEKKNSGEKKTE
jgi:lipoprotein NlpI